MKPPLLSWVNAYHGECFHVNSQRGSRECGITKAVMKKCLTDEDVTKDGGLNPDTFNINRVEENWDGKAGDAVWQNNGFSGRARAACETIIYMPCKPGKYVGGKFKPRDIFVYFLDDYKTDIMRSCKALIEAASSAGYELMIVENNWEAVSKSFEEEAQGSYAVFDTADTAPLSELSEDEFFEKIGYAWFLCKCKKTKETECNALKGDNT